MVFFFLLCCASSSIALHEQRKPQPSPVGVVFRGNHEGRAGVLADAMRAIEDDASRKKRDLKTKLPFTKKPTLNLSTNGSKLTTTVGS
jgi:hypothetical protein